MRRWIPIVIVTACSSGSGPARTADRGPGLPPAPSPPAPAPAPAVAATTYVGVVTTRASRVVATDFDARIDTLLVRAGQSVKAGDPIARLDASLLTAPIDGVVSLIRAKEGELAQAGTPIARIFDPADRRVRFAVPPELRAELAPGTAVHVIVPGAPRPLIAHVAGVTSVLEPPLQLAVVDADLDDAHPDTALAEVGAVIDVRRTP